MNLYKQVMIYIAWEKMKRWLWIPVFLIFAAFIRLLLANSPSSTVLDFIRDPVVSALAGAILGGVIAFYGSMYVQKAQVKSDAAISRRDEIYIPLYNELLSLQKTLNKRSCPDNFVYEINEDPHFSPKFAVWESFKGDNRHLHVPKQLANSLDNFINVTKKYSEARQTACRDVQVDAKMKEIFLNNFGAGYSSRVDLPQWYLPCSPNLTNLVEILNSHVNSLNKKDTTTAYTNEYFYKVAQEIYQETSKFEVVVRHQKLRIELDKRLEELTISMEKVIRYINEEFEQHEKWF